MWTSERSIVLAALVVLGLLSWFYLWAVPMPMPTPMLVPASTTSLSNHASAFTLEFSLLTFLMWFVMMIAMMLPAVLPVVLLFQRVAQRSTFPKTRALLFATGYFAAWAGFSLVATAVQFMLVRMDWIDDMGVAKHNLVSGALMAVVGIYQWLPIKSTCLQHCRSPVDFLTRYFRPSVLGASRMGFAHGLYCIGCCWLLMALLFVGGVMNLLWVTAITLIVVMEKIFAQGRALQRAIGVGLIVSAMVVLVRSA